LHFSVGIAAARHRVLMRLNGGELLIGGLSHLVNGLLVFFVMSLLPGHGVRYLLGLRARCQRLQNIFLNERDLFGRAGWWSVIRIHMLNHRRVLTLNGAARRD